MQEIKYFNKRSSSGDSSPGEFLVGFIPHKSGTYRIEISDQIEDVQQFSTAIQVLDMATENDDVEIHLQSPGGNVDACGAFLHSLRKCRANIHMIASGGVHSAGTHILLEADSFELAENFNSLIHNGSAGAYGNINEYHSKSDFDKKFIYDLYDGIYEGFLTPDEFKGMMRGDNLWLNAKDWFDRSLARQAYFEAKFAKKDKPARKPRAKKAVPSKEVVDNKDEA